MKKRFTLIELLVVIAIIAILAGMLLPALNSARERGRASKCISNMKNFSLMFFMYADEYGGFFPDRVHIGKVSQDGSGGGTMDAYYWQNLLIQIYQGVRTARRSRLTYCPSEKIPEGNWVGTFYGANNNIISGYDKNKTEAQNWMRRDPGKVGSFPKPAKTALLVENYGHGDYYLNVTYDPSAANTSSARAANFRHNKKCNVAFVDGHVAATEKKRVPCIESYPSAAFYQLQNTFFNLGIKKSGGGTINKDL